MARASMWDGYLTWLMSQAVQGYDMRMASSTSLRIEGEKHLGEVNSYELDEGSEVVEMRISRRSDGENVFFLHFMLDDLLRARELFGEMSDALCELAMDHRTRVLLSCTCGITTTMFATRMNELSETLGLGLDVQAKPLDQALAEPDSFDAVMLAPQVSYERKRVAAAYPHAVVFEIPARIFGSYDAPGAVRLQRAQRAHECGCRAARPNQPAARDKLARAHYGGHRDTRRSQLELRVPHL